MNNNVVVNPYVVRTYNRVGNNIYAERAYTKEEADRKFYDICKSIENTIEVFKKIQKTHYVKVVIYDVQNDKNITETVYEC
jgi:hypothetical protein